MKVGFTEIILTLITMKSGDFAILSIKRVRGCNSKLQGGGSGSSMVQGVEDSNNELHGDRGTDFELLDLLRSA